MVNLALDVMPSSSVTSATLRVTDTAPVSSWPRHASRLHAPGSPWPNATDSLSVSASGQVASRVFSVGRGSRPVTGSAENLIAYPSPLGQTRRISPEATGCSFYPCLAGPRDKKVDSKLIVTHLFMIFLASGTGRHDPDAFDLE
jgi:hypothetical protein